MTRGTVLVTGGARRIGRAISDALAACGWRVLVHSRTGASASALAVNLSEPDAAERLFSAAVDIAPDLCAVVNNAAVFSTAAVLEPGSAAELMHVNAEVPMALTQRLAFHLAKRGASAVGAVVNIVDSRILREGFAQTPYALSKHALLQGTLVDARRLAPQVRVNAVAPGPVLAPSEPANREPGGAILLSRRPAPSDVAAAVSFLLDAEAVTGQVVAVDSGQSITGEP